MRQGEVRRDSCILRIGLFDGGLALESVRRLGVVDVVDVFVGQVEKRRCLERRRRRCQFKTPVHRHCCITQRPLAHFESLSIPKIPKDPQRIPKESPKESLEIPKRI